MRSLSPAEERVLSILLKRKRPITTKDLIPLYYAGREVPQHARHSIVGTVTSLAEKTARGEERFKVIRTQRRGPKPIEVWVER